MTQEEFLDYYGLDMYEDFLNDNGLDFYECDYYSSESDLVNRLNKALGLSGEEAIIDYDDIPYKIDFCCWTVQEGYHVYFLSERLYDDFVYVKGEEVPIDSLLG